MILKENDPFCGQYVGQFMKRISKLNSLGTQKVLIFFYLHDYLEFQLSLSLFYLQLFLLFNSFFSGDLNDSRLLFVIISISLISKPLLKNRINELIINKSLLENFKNKALNFSNKSFFDNNTLFDEINLVLN